MMFNKPPRVSRRTAQRNLVRGMKFLGTLSRVPEVRAALEEGAGYSEEEHARGWSLLLTALGYIRKGSPAPAPSSLPQRSAMVELDSWDGVNFERARAALQFTFPEQYEYVFQGLSAATGADAIVTVQTFISRVVALRDGLDPARAASRAADTQAAERLAERKIFDPEVQAHLEALLARAKQLAPLPPVSPSAEELQNAADELHAWLFDWTTQARAFITRGDYLMRLGLTSTRARSASDEEEDADESDAEVAAPPSAEPAV